MFGGSSQWSQLQMIYTMTSCSHNTPSISLWQTLHSHLRCHLRSRKVTVGCRTSEFIIIRPNFLGWKWQAARLLISRDLVSRVRARWHWHRHCLVPTGCSDSVGRWRSWRTVLEHRMISRCGDISWPARWPDLSASRFFLWGMGVGTWKARFPKHVSRLN